MQSVLQKPFVIRGPHAMNFDPASMASAGLETGRRFFVDVAGLTEGARPPFSIDGYWLYANGRPVIHLIDATVPAITGRATPRIDHFAFRLESADEWEPLVRRLHATGMPYSLADVRQ